MTSLYICANISCIQNIPNPKHFWFHHVGYQTQPSCGWTPFSLSTMPHFMVRLDKNTCWVTKDNNSHTGRWEAVTPSWAHLGSTHGEAVTARWAALVVGGKEMAGYSQEFSVDLWSYEDCLLRLISGDVAMEPGHLLMGSGGDQLLQLGLLADDGLFQSLALQWTEGEWAGRVQRR